MTRVVAGVLLLALASVAHAGRFLMGYDEAPSLAKAFEQIKHEPKKHVLLYVDMSQRCPECTEVRALLTSDAVKGQWRNHYIVVSVDLFAPTKEDR